MTKPLILIVEDEPAIADNISYALTTEGFDTHWLAEGRPVLSLLASTPAALIILDIGLPDINGMELCKQIRQQTRIPIMFLTARAEEIDKVVGLEIGADDYMVKPFSPREMTARIKAILRRTQPSDKSLEPQSAPSVFILDEEKHRITYLGESLDLSRYEFLILKLFIRRPGQVFSRDRLMEAVWDDPGMSMDRTIDAHIKNLRQKLRQIRPDLDPIQTHRGIGYSLKEDL
ncbi:MAG: two-component system response regulator CreB [Desulfobacteraceae bacterium]|nr:MAG: two-component system response regulator CreB [Desulfobacteraceae bacterium]